MSLDKKTIQLASGATAAYVDTGTADRGTVVLIHGGLPGSSGRAGWRLLIALLIDAGYRVLAPDRPGFGDSDATPQHWPTRGYESWHTFMEEFVEAVGIDRFHLVGNSQGAVVAALYAVRASGRLETLTLIGSAGLVELMGIGSDRLVPRPPIPHWDGTTASMRTSLESIVRRTDRLTDELLAERNAAALKQQDSLASAMRWNRDAMNDPERSEQIRLDGRLDRIAIPALYVHGVEDSFAPVKNARLLEELLPTFVFAYIEDCGHQVQTDQPEQLMEVLLQNFARGA